MLYPYVTVFINLHENMIEFLNIHSMEHKEEDSYDMFKRKQTHTYFYIYSYIYIYI